MIKVSYFLSKTKNFIMEIMQHQGVQLSWNNYTPGRLQTRLYPRGVIIPWQPHPLKLPYCKNNLYSLVRYYSIGAFLTVRLLFFLYELPARLVKWSQKQNNQATMPKLRHWLWLFLFAGALQRTLDLERQAVSSHRTQSCATDMRSPCSSSA